MLELRVVVGARQIASMRDSILRECRRAHADEQHAQRVAHLATALIAGGDDTLASKRPRGRRRSHVLVIVTVQSDATMLMVRDPRPHRAELGDRRQTLLQSDTSRWSTMSGSNGRTIWAEVSRAATAPESINDAPRAATSSRG
jgi:hypothetical protein